MSGEVFDVKHSSSVHLQGLGKLVSAFRASDNEQDLRLQASDGVASQAMYSKSKDRRLALSNFTGNNTRLEPIQNVPFEERLNGNTSEENKKGKLCLDFTSTFGTDHVDTQHTKNSLYLINELCDRLTAGTSQSNNRYNDYLGTETTLVALNTPSTSTTQRLSYPEAHKQIVLSAPSTFSSNYGSYNDQQPPSPLYTSALQNTLQQSRLCEQNGGEGECAVLSTENASFSRKNNGQDYLAEGNQSLGSSQPTGAISHMQQMLEQLTPPPERIPGKQASADPIGQLSRDDVLQCTSLEGRDTGSGSLVTPSSQSSPSSAGSSSQNSPGKYSELLAVIEELGKDIRPTYAGSKNAAERLKKGIMHARVLVRECLVETDKCARQ